MDKAAASMRRLRLHPPVQVRDILSRRSTSSSSASVVDQQGVDLPTVFDRCAQSQILESCKCECHDGSGTRLHSSWGSGCGGPKGSVRSAHAHTDHDHLTPLMQRPLRSQKRMQAKPRIYGMPCCFVHFGPRFFRKTCNRALRLWSSRWQALRSPSLCQREAWRCPSLWEFMGWISGCLGASPSARKPPCRQVLPDAGRCFVACGPCCLHS